MPVIVAVLTTILVVASTAGPPAVELFEGLYLPIVDRSVGSRGATVERTIIYVGATVKGDETVECGASTTSPSMASASSPTTGPKSTT